MLNIHHLESFYYVARFGGLTHASLPSGRARAQNRFHSATAQRTEMQLETAGERLGFLRHYLSVLPDVNRGPVSLRSLSCRSGRTPEGATDGCAKLTAFVFFPLPGFMIFARESAATHLNYHTRPTCRQAPCMWSRSSASRDGSAAARRREAHRDHLASPGHRFRGQIGQ